MKTITSNGKDYSLSNFWLCKIDLETASHRKDIDLNMSMAEHTLDALVAHQTKLFEELENLRDIYVGEARPDLNEIIDSFRNGEFARTMEAIKGLNLLISLIATDVAADLREIGNSIKNNP